MTNKIETVNHESLISLSAPHIWIYHAVPSINHMGEPKKQIKFLSYLYGVSKRRHAGSVGGMWSFAETIAQNVRLNSAQTQN